MNKRHILGLAAVALGLGLVACTSAPTQPMPTEARVDLPRFMGDWYVIANIPTYFERGAHNAVESYRLAPDGTVDIAFSYRKDSFTGDMKNMAARGFILDSTNALWGAQFIWPIKADYRIAHVGPAYDTTIIAREKRDFVWIMARTPTIPEAHYQALLQRVAALGYDTAKVERVPQQQR